MDVPNVSAAIRMRINDRKVSGDFVCPSQFSVIEPCYCKALMTNKQKQRRDRGKMKWVGEVKRPCQLVIRAAIWLSSARFCSASRFLLSQEICILLPNMRMKM